MGSPRIRLVCDADIESLLACARVSFGPDRAKSRAEWEWAFRRPGFEPRGLVAVEEGQVIGAYLGISQTTWIGGEERVCVQPVDLMVHPDHRRGSSENGLYLELAEAFIDLYGIEGGDVFHYGWPVEAARLSGQKLVSYEFLREELCLFRELDTAPMDRPQEVTEVAELGPDLRWLWDRCARDWGAATIRDAAWARWRFLERPRCEYLLLGVRDRDCLRGLAVLRRTRWDWDGAVPLCDWMVPDDEPEIARLLEQGICSQARQWGAQSLVTLLPDSSSAFSRFQESNWRVKPVPYQSVVRTYDRRFDVDWLRAHWWYTLADSDLA